MLSFFEENEGNKHSQKPTLRNKKKIGHDIVPSGRTLQNNLEKGKVSPIWPKRSTLNGTLLKVKIN
jgi:hypothetical protein